ncbi:MAG TPA: DUF2784 domain-containing protein [Blastocatellia bacterium]|nr:DUF2784 domain-containing protein [Blastocatellia bacterium]
MIYRALADFVVLIHMAFVLFVAIGGLLVFKWRRVAWFHIPAALWGALIEFAGWVCPLTPLENWLRRRGGEAGYQTGFIEHYILPLIYPAPLSRGLQVVLGLLVLGFNLAIYWRIWRRFENAPSLRHSS